ncbi:hypothetical protein SSBG_06046 [Streptomyces sp. SPB074]|nr:hypothetical protein SSBG_06046 [Streptomyces sp. SPB074]
MVAVLPHRLQKLLAAEDLAGGGREGEQEAQFGGGERDRRALVGDAEPGAVDREAAVGLGRRGAGRVLAAQHRADARVEHARPHRLDDVVVRPRLQPHHDIDVVAPGGHDEQRYLRPLRRAQPPAHLQAVHAGQHQVEHHDLGHLGREGRDPSSPLAAARTSCPCRRSPRVTARRTASSSSMSSTRDMRPVCVSGSGPSVRVRGRARRLLRNGLTGGQAR